MNEPDDFIAGRIVGVNLSRRPAPSGPLTNLDSYVVRLCSGREVVAIVALSPLPKPFMVRTIRIGAAIKVDLGTVLEPIRVVAIEDDPD